MLPARAASHLECQSVVAFIGITHRTPHRNLMPPQPQHSERGNGSGHYVQQPQRKLFWERLGILPRHSCARLYCSDWTPLFICGRCNGDVAPLLHCNEQRGTAMRKQKIATHLEKKEEKVKWSKERHKSFKRFWNKLKNKKCGKSTGATIGKVSIKSFLKHSHSKLLSNEFGGLAIAHYSYARVPAMIILTIPSPPSICYHNYMDIYSYKQFFPSLLKLK